MSANNCKNKLKFVTVIQETYVLFFWTLCHEKKKFDIMYWNFKED